MPVIAEHLGINPKGIKYTHHEALIGIGALGFEVELENSQGGRWPEVQGWVRKDDGSLRAGKEYIFDGPQSGAQALASLQNFHEVMAKVKPDPTFRCSTHVHLDVRDLSFVEYERLVLTYIVFEDTMFDMIDRRRRDSNFCIPFYKNDWLSSTFGRRILGVGTERAKFQGAAGWPKYSALNLQVTANFGSVEFRGAHAMTDKAELLALGQRMLHLKRTAVESKAKDHHQYIKELEELGVHGVFRQGIPKDYTMDEGALEQGVATAMHCILVSMMAHNNVEERGRRDAVPRNEFQRTLQIIQREGVELNMEVLREMNMAPRSPRLTASQAYNLVNSINKLQGFDVSITSVVRNIPAAHLAWLRQNREEYNRATGHNFTDRQAR